MKIHLNRNIKADIEYAILMEQPFIYHEDLSQIIAIRLAYQNELIKTIINYCDLFIDVGSKTIVKYRYLFNDDELNQLVLLFSHPKHIIRFVKNNLLTPEHARIIINNYMQMYGKYFEKKWLKKLQKVGICEIN